MNLTDKNDLHWTPRWTLTTRILAVNLFAVAMLAISFFYLDNYRNRLLENRKAETGDEVRLMADAIHATAPNRQQDLIRYFATQYHRRVRLYRHDRLAIDSAAIGAPGYTLVNPDEDPLKFKAARWLDTGFDWIVGRPFIEPYIEPSSTDARQWPEIGQAYRLGKPVVTIRTAPDHTPILVTAMPLPMTGRDKTAALLVTENARDITSSTRLERFFVSIAFAAVALGSVLLSLFLANTIVRPLRQLARAAERVKLGRSREVAVPRLPDRKDEIGDLARALAVMTQTLRSRIDASESFAADLTHELKNPLASLRSALETLEKVEKPELRQQLLDIIRHDGERLDRLVTDIADISRLDAELTRTRFELFDVGALLESLATVWNARTDTRNVQVRVEQFGNHKPLIMGDKDRIARVFHNLIDNAQSFSPDNALVAISITADKQECVITVSDQGPGISPERREAIFERFHSDRPASETFGRHSGLGLAIARTIIDGHGGHIQVENTPHRPDGACFSIRLPVGR